MADYPTFTAPYRAAMTQTQAQKQAGNELSGLYQRAFQNLMSQQYQSQLSAAEQSAARGLSHSGLAQDAMNKIALGTQNSIADMEAERAAKVATLARQILERDQDVAFRERQQSYNEWNGQQGLRLNLDQFNFNKQMEQDKFSYQKQRDAVADSQWQQQFNLSKQRAATSGGSSGGGGRSSSSRRGSSSRRSGRSYSSSSSSSSAASVDTSGYTLDQIKWYSNPANAPYKYGQQKPQLAANKAPLAPSYAAALPPKKPAITGYQGALAKIMGY